MEYLKLYEDYKNEPQVGDYCLCRIGDDKNYRIKDELNKYLSRYVCEIIDISNNGKELRIRLPFRVPNELTFYPISYNVNIRTNVKYFSIRITKDELIAYSPFREDMEVLIKANKYNI